MRPFLPPAAHPEYICTKMAPWAAHKKKKEKRGYPAERRRSKAHAPQEAVILYKYNARKEEERHPAPHTRALRPVASLLGPIAKLPCA